MGAKQDVLPSNKEEDCVAKKLLQSNCCNIFKRVFWRLAGGRRSVYQEKEDYKIWSDIRIVSGLENIMRNIISKEHPRDNIWDPEIFWLQWTSSRPHLKLFNLASRWGNAPDSLPHLLSISGRIFPDDYNTGNVISARIVIWNMPPPRLAGTGGDSGAPSVCHIVISTPGIGATKVKWFLMETNLKWRLASAQSCMRSMRVSVKIAQDIFITELPHLIFCRCDTWWGRRNNMLEISSQRLRRASRNMLNSRTW